MAVKSGTVKSCSRQGTGSTQSRTVVLNNSNPPPQTYTFEADEDYYRDALAAGSRNVEITFNDTVTPYVIEGLKVTN